MAEYADKYIKTPITGFTRSLQRKCPVFLMTNPQIAQTKISISKEVGSYSYILFGTRGKVPIDRNYIVLVTRNVLSFIYFYFISLATIKDERWNYYPSIDPQSIDFKDRAVATAIQLKWRLANYFSTFWKSPRSPSWSDYLQWFIKLFVPFPLLE